MPVRFLIYIAITALTRELIGSISIEHQADIRIIMLTGGILLLAIAALVLRYGSYRYPSVPTDRSPLAPGGRESDDG
jgi:phosphate starvation-inducible membrane PsiE